MEQTSLQPQLEELGLKRIQHLEKSVYELDIPDEATDGTFTFTLSILRYEDGDTAVQLEEAELNGSSAMVPLHIRQAALDKLKEIEQLCEGIGCEEQEQPLNGSMAPDMAEMKKLGNEMKHMKTNSELLEQNQIPDPIQ